MGKGDQTRQEILHKVAVLFNEKGYTATSMQDVTAVTGIKRGGIYNHFASKEELALATFEYACGVLEARLRSDLHHQQSAVGQLRAIASNFAELYTQNPFFPYGCPVLNAAIEAKRQNLALRQKAQAVMSQLKALITEIARQGIRQGELPDSINADAVAAVFISTLEGAMLLSVLYDDVSYLNHAVNHLHWYADSLTMKMAPFPTNFAGKMSEIPQDFKIQAST
ncbi:MAG: TetR/AcrR family transcriptional regulator [Cyanothece sp. SIO1E1]|nr:TetR/AcrR family transcriptional regulator [Cyanothece sp. SIO1E1]